jgi:DNA repair exonuclease SbcCD ATPase subunit
LLALILPLGLGIMLLLFIRFHVAVPMRATVMVPDSLPADAGSLLNDADAILASAKANLQVFTNTVTGLRSRQATLANQINDVSNLRQRLAVALRQAQYEGRWPIAVSSYRFNQPRDVEAAIEKADQYLQRAAQNQAEILRENAQLDQTQRHAERIVQSMTQVRQQMTYTPATTSLQNDDRQLQTLNVDLQNTLSQLQKIDAGRVDLRPFSLFN